MDVPASANSRYDFAIQCGGKPYLATTTRDAAERAFAHRAAYRDWTDEQAAEARQEWAQGQFEQSVAEAKASSQRHRSAQEALEAALAAAEAAASD